MKVLAPAKVNLCLFLGPVRGDGRHRLVTVFESVSLADELIVETNVSSADEVVCPGVEGPNLVTDALAGLRARGWQAPPVRITITKQIPVAAGMGGGSADAAAALRLAPHVGPVDAGAVTELAAALGADVPGQLEPGLALGTGAGEVVERLPPLASHSLLVVPLPYTLSTPAVYEEADRLGLPRAAGELRAFEAELRAALPGGGRLPASMLINDLEPAAWSLCPAIAEALAALRDAGAEHAFVCGSGPTCAGLWWEEPDSAARAARALAARYPGSVVVKPVLIPGRRLRLS